MENWAVYTSPTSERACIGNAFTFNFGRRQNPSCAPKTRFFLPPSNASSSKWLLQTTLYGLGPLQSVLVDFTAFDHFKHRSGFDGNLKKLTAALTLLSLVQPPKEQRLPILKEETVLIKDLPRVRWYVNGSPQSDPLRGSLRRCEILTSRY